MDKHHILVVDDNHINRLFFDSSLKKLGAQVSTAKDGFQALELCRTHKFNLILMDIRMNGMDGIETAAAIKTIDHNTLTPILAISAEHFDCKKHADFVASLLKPISQEQLKNTITKHLNEPLSFDHELALKISHNDEQIVAKLRIMLINQLPDDWQHIEQFKNTQDWSKLNNYLHKMLGSAKVCAATLLIKRIEALKAKIVTQQEMTKEYQLLKAAIDKTINSA